MTNPLRIKSQILNAVGDMKVYQYAMLRTDEIVFDDTLRLWCKKRCPHYKSCWSCPPAVGNPEKCRERCRSYDGALLFSTFDNEMIDERTPDLIWEPFLSPHEQLTCRIEKLFEQQHLQLYTLTGNVCRACKKCTYPKSPCRSPEIMHPCIEGHGISLPALCEKCGMDYFIDQDTTLLFSLILFKGLTKTILS